MGTYKTISEIIPSSCRNEEEGNCIECPYCKEIDGYYKKIYCTYDNNNNLKVEL